jgi:hypothetical protein
MSLIETMHRVVNVLMSDVGKGGLKKFTLGVGEWKGSVLRYKIYQDVMFAVLRKTVYPPVVLCVGRFQMYVEFNMIDGLTERFSCMDKTKIDQAVEFVKMNPSGVWKCKRRTEIDFYNQIDHTYLRLKCGDFEMFFDLLPPPNDMTPKEEYIQKNLCNKMRILRLVDSAPSIYKPADFYDVILLEWFSEIQHRDDTSQMQYPEDQKHKFSSVVLQYIFNSLEGFDAARDVVVAYVAKHCVKFRIYIDAATKSELASPN